MEEQSGRSEHDTSGAEPCAMLRLKQRRILSTWPAEEPVQEVWRDLPTRTVEEPLQGVRWVGDLRLPAPAGEEPLQEVLRVLDEPTRMGEEPMEGVHWMPARAANGQVQGVWRRYLRRQAVGEKLQEISGCALDLSTLICLSSDSLHASRNIYLDTCPHTSVHTCFYTCLYTCPHTCLPTHLFTCLHICTGLRMTPTRTANVDGRRRTNGHMQTHARMRQVHHTCALARAACML